MSNVTGKLEAVSVEKQGVKIDNKWYKCSAQVATYANEKLIGKNVEIAGQQGDTITMLKAVWNKGGSQGGGNKSYNNNNKSFPKKDDDYALGQQVGNAITNAATICGPGTSVADLFNVAEQIIVGGNALKEKIKAGTIGKAKAAPAAAQAPAQEEPSFDNADTPSFDSDSDCPFD